MGNENRLMEMNPKWTFYVTSKKTEQKLSICLIDLVNHNYKSKGSVTVTLE